MARTLANYDQLFDLSIKLNSMASDIAGLKVRGDSVVGGTEWDGNSAARFREFWKQFSLDLTKAQELISQGAVEVKAKGELYQRADA